MKLYTLPDMYRYRVFGGILAAPFPFPELQGEERVSVSRETAGPEWFLRLGVGKPSTGGRLAGEDELAPGISARLFRTTAGLRLELDDTGEFEIEDRGTAITWFPREGHDPVLARVDIVGRVLAAAVHERGFICLHGSAVSIGGVAVGFVAPKGAGKSTLASAIIGLGGGSALITDDTLPVDPSTGLARAGVQSVRLMADAAEQATHLGRGSPGLSNKSMFGQIPADLIEHRELPVAAIYELTPREVSDGVPVRRVALPAAEGTVALMRHSKLGGLLDGTESIAVFDGCTRLAARAAVYRLEVQRDADALADMARTIRSWHE